MKALKIFAIAAMTVIFAASASASAMPEPQSNIISALTGSKNLVNTQNSNNVLGALSQISNLDLSSESTKEAAASTAKAAASSGNLLSAASTLTSLFGAFKK